MERKLRMDELKQKEEVKRQLVEDRKKAINEAEKDRLESILKRNQEREARIEAKKRNERHSIVFAFGSSTPRMLQPTDSVGSFWGHRRATSTQNITTVAAAPLTRRQSERELDGGMKKRATSAGGLERSVEGSNSTQIEHDQNRIYFFFLLFDTLRFFFLARNRVSHIFFLICVHLANFLFLGRCVFIYLQICDCQRLCMK